ncbi:MAG: DNA repair protein RecN [Chloroflexi bacterium]|nr:DNA repair protein RecN [Chloroflexota bacterium]
MLTELNIRNFAIIDELRVQFHQGFNVLTGETGAGKSIILDAVMLMLGGRADTSMIRAGASKAYVEASFSMSPALQKVMLPLLAAEGLDEEGSKHLLIARELRDSGRNICRVNGRGVNLAVLRQIAEPLIDIHGQGDHLSLLKPRSHLPLLDSYAGLNVERKAFAAEVHQLNKLKNELNELNQNERIRAQRIDMLQFQIQEIGAAKLQVNEESDLREERTRLANSEQLMRHATEAVTLMTGMDDESTAVADMLGQAERALVQLTRYDESKAPVLEGLQGLVYQLSELSADLQTYLNSLEFNPKRLDHVEERLELISSLKRKYGDDIATILALREKGIAELEKITHSEERIAELEALLEKRLHQLGELASALTQKRREAGNRLSQAIEAQMGDLNMEGAQFTVEIRHEPAEHGAYVGDAQLAFDATGVDKVEFLISTNPGEPLKPMAKVASGGETARLMLALKTALAQIDETPTLIFDEIDQGIGGRIGDVVGKKLWGLTAVADHQVIVVTHLPQLAGYGDIHFRVSKQVSEGRTITAVSELGHVGRVRELAEMLGTQIDHARGGAESILQQAASVKHEVRNGDKVAE